MRIMFPVRIFIISLAFASVSFATEIKQAHMQRYGVNDFQSISEFFSGKENTGKYLILRTTPEERAGVYIDIRLDEKVAELPSGSNAILHVVFDNNRNPQIFTFPIKGEKLDTKKVLLGITGDQWKNKPKSIAWLLELRDASNNVICSKKSFLWELPQ
jgi:hypothetical protein